LPGASSRLAPASGGVNPRRLLQSSQVWFIAFAESFRIAAARAAFDQLVEIDLRAGYDGSLLMVSSAAFRRIV